MRQKHSVEQRRAWIEKLNVSNLSVAAFARQNDLCAKTLWNWKARLADEPVNQIKKSCDVDFVELPIPAQTQRVEPRRLVLRITTASGCTIEVPL